LIALDRKFRRMSQTIPRKTEAGSLKTHAK